MTDRSRLIFHFSLTLGGILGESPLAPGSTRGTFIAFLGSVVGILGAVGPAVLTLVGAHSAGASPPPDIP